MLRLLIVFGVVLVSALFLWIGALPNRSPFAHGAPNAPGSSESTENFGPLIDDYIVNNFNQNQKKSLTLGDEEDLTTPLKEFIKYISAELEDRSSKEANKKSSRVVVEDKMIPINLKPKFMKKDNCTCVNFYKCDVDSTDSDKILGGSGEAEEDDDEGDLSLINIRLNIPEGGCSHYLEICCEKIKQQSHLDKLPNKPPKKKARVCGERNPDGIGFRILGGKSGEAQFGEFPWMSAITKKIVKKYPDDKSFQYIGGGSLIHPKVVMTAAHVVKNLSADILSVRLGEWDTQTENEIYPHQDSIVEQVIIHENYTGRHWLKYDIALVVLKDEIELAPNIATICLSAEESNFDGQRCQASGWGREDYSNDSPNPVILKKIDLPIVPSAECEERIREEISKKKNVSFKLHKSLVCAGGEVGKDTCKGDGGSPLVCNVPETPYYVQYGMVAWGLGCGKPIPGVYANVPSFVPWINEQMDILGLDKSFYTP